FTVTVTAISGVNCRTTGKLSGRGGTLTARAQAVFATGFQNDVCGAVTDASGLAMTVFNYDTLTGTPIGLAAASCRTDGVFGTDGPYTLAQLGQLNGAPGAMGCSAFAGATGPYAPGAEPYPADTDVAAPVMTFPVAGTSVGIGVNLQAADCGGTKPSG